MQGVTVKMSQEDLDAIKKAMQKQKGAGGGEEAGFVEVSCSQQDSAVLETQGLVIPRNLRSQPAQQATGATLVHATCFTSPTDSFLNFLSCWQGILEEVKLITWPNPLQVGTSQMSDTCTIIPGAL